MKWLLLTPTLLLTSCIEIKLSQPEQNPQLTKCYSLVNLNNAAAPSPFLLNECTGESWLLLRSSDELNVGELEPSYSWGWYKIYISQAENTLAAVRDPLAKKVLPTPEEREELENPGLQ